MGVERLFIVSKSGGLIYSFDNQQQTITSQPIEATFSHPLPFKLGLVENKLVVEFECGETGGVKCGHVLLNYNQHEVHGQRLGVCFIFFIIYKSNSLLKLFILLIIHC